MMKKYLLMLLIPVALFSVSFAAEDRSALYTLKEYVEMQIPEDGRWEVMAFSPRADAGYQLWDPDEMQGFCYSQSQFIYHSTGLTIDDVYGIIIEGGDSCCCCQKNKRVDFLDKTNNSMLVRSVEIDEDGNEYLDLHRLILTDHAYHAITCSIFHFDNENKAPDVEAKWCELLNNAKIVQK